MRDGPVIETENLTLRVPSGAEFDEFAASAEDEETMRFIGGVQSRSEAWRAWCTVAGSWLVEGFGMFSVIERESGRWVGRIGPWRPADWPGNEIGWSVARGFEGKGYAYEAAVASIDYAFDVLGWDEVMHAIDPGNIRSIRLAERLGATNKGPTKIPPPFSDVRVDKWSQTKDEWRARRGA